MASRLLAGLIFAPVIVPLSRSVRATRAFTEISLTRTPEENPDFLAAAKTWCYEIQALRAFVWMDWAMRESPWYPSASN